MQQPYQKKPIGIEKNAFKPLSLLFILMAFNIFCFGQQFTVYNSWDFESEDLGEYTDAEIGEDFDYSILYSHNSADIVMDTINNLATKVFRVTHPANTLSNGFEINVYLDDYDELYLSYNVKFSEEFNSTAGGKLPGLGAHPDFGAYCPTGYEGFRAHNMFKHAGRIISYHYDRTTGTCPWAIDTYNYDSIYFNNGTWYNITQRLVLNSFTNGVANADGIKELWVDGRLIYQRNDLKFMGVDNDTMKIDAFRFSNFYGGASDDYRPATECYGYFDNFKVYMPSNDSISGYELHHHSTILPTPVEITNRTLYYDSLRTTEGTLSNTEYGSNYSSCIDEAYLIDAGEGNTVNLNITAGTIGGGDYLFFYDGNTSDADFIDMVEGYSSSFTGIRESSGRYMFVRFSTDTDGGTAGWTGTISFDGDTLAPLPPTGLHVTDSTDTSISIAWTDASSNESKFIIERSTGSFVVIDSVNANVTSYTDTGLTPNTTYSYRVKAKNSNGESSYSNVCQGTTQDTSSVDNIALGKTATQSSTVYSGSASLAVDGDTDGDFFNSSVTHTDNETNAWWQVDLGQVYSISSIEVWNRTDCCMDRLDNYYVMLADTFTSTTLSTALSESNWSEHKTTYPDTTHYFSPSSSGRYIRVQLGDTDNLSLAEVIVFGSDTTGVAPSAPSSLSATDSTATTITIGWTDNADNEDKFIIDRSLSSGSGFAVIDSVNANVTSYTDTGLSSTTTYYYKVKARNSYGDSGYSNEENATTLTEPVTDTTWVSTMKVNFTESGYSGGSEWNDFLTYTSTSSLSLDDSLGNSTGYTLYNEDSWDGPGYGGETTGPYPQNVNQTYWYKNVSECDLELRSLDNDNLYSIEVYASRDIDITRQIRVTIDSDYDIITVNNNTSEKAIFPYVSPSSGVIRMEITIETNEYSYLNAIVVREYELSGGTTPTAPTNLHTTDSTATTITFGWTDNASNEDKFIIERSFLSGSGFAAIDSVSANVTSYTDTGLITDTTYYYKVKAKNSYGESSYSNTLEAHTDDVTITNVALSKTATQSSTVYEGYASRAVDGNTDGVWANGSVTHTDDETNAWWQVDLGDDFQVTSIEVWNRTAYMDRLDNYYVMLADTFTSTSLSTALSESNWSEHRTTYPDTTHYFYPDTTGHYVRVQLGDTDNLSLAEVIVWGYDADLKKAGLSEEINPGLEPEKPINVYPNPGSTMITISGFEQAVEIKMVDMLGKVVYLEDKVNNSTQIDVSNLKKGLYLILVKKENNIHITKFIKK